MCKTRGDTNIMMKTLTNLFLIVDGWSLNAHMKPQLGGQNVHDLWLCNPPYTILWDNYVLYKSSSGF